MTLADRLASSELPRRILGAVLSVFVPGAGHIVLGYSTLGWTIAGASLLLGAIVIGGALASLPTLFLVAGALYILGTVASVVSVFALPPGPRLKDGLRALWPVMVLFLVFRGAGALVSGYALQIYKVPDSAMLPYIANGDHLMASARGYSPAVGDVVVVENPRAHGLLMVERVIARAGQRVRSEGAALVVDGQLVAETAPTEVTIREADNDGKPRERTFKQGYAQLAGRRFAVLHRPGAKAPPALREMTLAPGELYVVGDNRAESLDSRMFGPISESAVKGKALFVFAAAGEGRDRVWKPLWSPAP